MCYKPNSLGEELREHDSQSDYKGRAREQLGVKASEWDNERAKEQIEWRK